LKRSASALVAALKMPTSPPTATRAMERVVAAGKAAGKAVGILTGEKDARRYLDMGMTLVAVGGDVGIFKAATKALADRFKTDGA